MPVVGTCPYHGIVTMPCLKCAEGDKPSPRKGKRFEEDQIPAIEKAMKEIGLQLERIGLILQGRYRATADDWDESCTPLICRD